MCAKPSWLVSPAASESRSALRAVQLVQQLPQPAELNVEGVEITAAQRDGPQDKAVEGGEDDIGGV
jgi:hypothetical protein